MKSIIQTSLISSAILAAPLVAEAGFCGKDKKYGKHNIRVYTSPYEMWSPYPMYYAPGYYYSLPQTYYSYVPQAPYPIQQKSSHIKPQSNIEKK